MEAHEVNEIIEGTEVGESKLRIYGALIISFLALCLAIFHLGGTNAAKNAIEASLLTSDTFSFYQAKSAKQTLYQIAVDQLEISLINDKLLPQQKDEIEKKIKQYKDNINRYESDEKTKEGKKELFEKAKEYEHERDTATRRDPWFDFSESILQIAIVVTSVALIIESAPIVYIAGAIGVVGILIGINGFFLFI